MEKSTGNRRSDHPPGGGPARGVVIAVIVGLILWVVIAGVAWVVAQ